MSLTSTIQQQKNNNKEEKPTPVANPHARVQLKYQTLNNLATSLDEFSVLPYYVIYTVPALLLVSIYLRGVWLLSPIAFVFGVIPILDLVVSPLKLNPTAEQEKVLEKQLRYRICTWLWVAVQLSVTLFASYVYSTFDLSIGERVGLVLSTGVVGAASINVAHELGHKLNQFEKRLAVISLSFVSYMHFQIEHIHGHHWNVATPKDPATSRLGESFYQFYPRTVIGSWRSALSLEEERLKKEGKEFWSLDNSMITYTLTPLFIASSLGYLFGPLAFSFFFLQSFIGFSLLEVVNYIEHYGLEREEIAPGKYEPVRPIHSWNADERVTNYFLFKLQRHSDHHTFPVRRYQILRSFEESPQLPTGYAGGVLLALIPPLWRYVMDWRVMMLRESVKKLKEEAKAKCLE